MPEPGVLPLDVPGADPGDQITVCADCGKPVFWYPVRERWAAKVNDNPEVWSFTCRLTREDGLLIAADYHHVAGEPQVRWRLGEGQYVEGS